MTAARDLARAALVPLSREQVDIALPLLREALEIDPSDTDAQALFATALMACGRVDEGVALAESAAETAPTSFLPRLKAGEIGIRIGDLAGAERHFLAALAAARPGSPDAQAARALLAEARVRSRRAIAHHAQMPGLGGRIRWRAPWRWRPRSATHGPVDPVDGEAAQEPVPS